MLKIWDEILKIGDEILRMRAASVGENFGKHLKLSLKIFTITE